MTLLPLKRESAVTVAGALFIPLILLAIAVDRSQPVLPLHIITIAQFATSAFFVVLLLRQSLVFRQSADKPHLVANANPTSLLAPAGAVLITALAYVRTVFFYFTCDDFEHVATVREPFLTSIWPQFTRGQFDGSVHIYYRPLGFMSIFLDYRIWHGWAPGYHVTNVLLHLLCVAAVFVICRELHCNDEVSGIAALLFGILPVNAQAVTWIACRFDQLATVFVLWSLVFALRFRKKRNLGSYLAVIALFLLAALSKESAYALPLLWLTLELLPQKEDQSKVFSSRTLLWLIGYVTIPGLAFAYRYHVLGGVGGYAEARHFGLSSLVGMVVRAPSAMLLGNNSFQTLPVSLNLLLLLIVATAAIFIALALLSATERIPRGYVWFSLIWIVVSIVPAHFYFASPYSGVAYARALYFGSAGMAILLAMLVSSAFQQPRVRLGCVLILGTLLIGGLQQNLAAWKWVSDSTQTMLTELKRVEPSPAPGASFHIANVPEYVRAVPFFTVGLQNAVRFGYQRSDITVDRLTAAAPLYPTPADIYIAWQDPHTLGQTVLGRTTDAKAVRLRSDGVSLSAQWR